MVNLRLLCDMPDLSANRCRKRAGALVYVLPPFKLSKLSQDNMVPRLIWTSDGKAANFVHILVVPLPQYSFYHGDLYTRICYSIVLSLLHQVHRRVWVHPDTIMQPYHGGDFNCVHDMFGKCPQKPGFMMLENEI